MPVLLELSEQYAERIKTAFHPYLPDADRQDLVLMKKDGDQYLLITESEVLSNDDEYVSLPDHLFKTLVDAEAIQILNRAEYHYHLAILAAAVGLAEGGLWSCLPNNISEAKLITLVAPSTAILSFGMELLYFRYKREKWPNGKELEALISDAKLTCVQIVADILGELFGNEMTTSTNPILTLLFPSLGSATFVTTALAFTESPFGVNASEEKETIMRAAGFFRQNGQVRRRVKLASNGDIVETVIQQQKRSCFDLSFLRSSNAGIFFGSGSSTAVWNIINPWMDVLVASKTVPMTIAEYLVRPAIMSLATGIAFGMGVVIYKQIAQSSCFQGKNRVNELLLKESQAQATEDEETAKVMNSSSPFVPSYGTLSA